MTARAAKRVIDVLGALVGLIGFAPVMAVIAVLVRWRLGAPGLFRQQRTGLREQAFDVVKFRTMSDQCDDRGVPLPDVDRLSPFGRRLRSTSLDELPELWNVLRGQMSLVGPRPLPPHYLPFYTTEERRRHDVRPGMTGWAQINGRNQTSWDDRLAMDVWYVENQSLFLDVRILCRTVGAVLRRAGISASDAVTMRALDEVRA